MPVDFSELRFFDFLTSKSGIQFAQLQLLWVVLGVLALIALIQWRKRKHYVAHSMVNHPLLAQMKPSYLRWAPGILMTLGVVAAGITLLDPRVTFREAVTSFEGLDIILCVDLSSSMQEVLGAQELRKVYETKLKAGDKSKGPQWETRMQALQKALYDVINRRKNDRLGLVVFSENSYVISPLTMDHSYLEKYVAMVDPEILIGEGMTAIGEGVTSAMRMFMHEQEVSGSIAESKNKVIIVFTDGENNFGRDPIEAMAEARFRGYRCYLIGVDLPPEVTRKETQKMLVQAVYNTGGRYYDAQNKEQLMEADAQIDRIEKGVFVERTVETDVPVYQVFVYFALALLGIALVLKTIPYFAEIS